MRIYQKNPNRTALEIADMIKAKEFEISVTNCKRLIIEPISHQAYQWLRMGNTVLASLVEELLDGKYCITIQEVNFGIGDYYIDIDWKIVES